MLAIGLNLSSYRIYIMELLKSRKNLIIRKMVKVEVPTSYIIKGEVHKLYENTESLLLKAEEELQRVYSQYELKYLLEESSYLQIS